jgi:hypothetical protein
MITKFGKRFLTSYIAGNVGFAQKDIALGIGTTTPNAKGKDTRLDFEFYRLPATLGSIDISQTGVDSENEPVFSYTAIYKATIPQDIAGVISEVGLYPGARTSNNNFDSKFLTDFENNLLWSDGSNNPVLRPNEVSPEFTARIGENMVQYNVVASSTKEYTNALVLYDISGYSVNDTLSIAYKKNDNNLSKIRVKLYSSDTAYCWVDFTPLTGTGDRIQSTTLNNLFSNVTATAPDLTAITKIGVEVTAGSGGNTEVHFDGIRINDEDTFDPSYGMISRSLLSTPLVKPSGRPVDIEYKLVLGF